MKSTPPFLAALLLASAGPARCDEGMWLYSAPPRDRVLASYGYKIEDSWLNHLEKASVRFNSGGSGSFVSGDGLVITNHHVGLDALQKMSNAAKNFVHDGFYAATAAEEVKCLDLELNVLQSTEDVTARVNAAVSASAAGDEAAAARRKVFAEIEKESKDATGLRSDVITLYQGGQYHLYRYKRYTDVRLVFAPEQQAAFFGGDPDNFEYPRYDMDICIFRVYENGQAIHPEHFLKWSVTGPKDGDLVFVSGNPGRTERLFTVAQLELLRDLAYPATDVDLKRRDALLTAWSARSGENLRRAKEEIFYVRNSRKLYDGLIAGLQDPQLIGAKKTAEASLKYQLAQRADGKEALQAFDRISLAEGAIARIYVRERMLESARAFTSESFGIARTLLRAGDEMPKPNGQRLPEFADQRKDTLELGLFSEKPIYEDLETLTLGDSLTEFVEVLGYDDQTVQDVLAGKSPRARASELVNGTSVREVAFRRRLYAGGAPAVLAAHDPMIELARSVDEESRALRKSYEADKETEQKAQAVIGRARYEILGTSTYPDATFTLRLAYGSVKGYDENGVHVPALTTIAGLYERASEHGNREPFELPASWAERKADVNLETPMNFVTDCDIIGGDSGSPVVNANGEFVGIIFDGNIESLPMDLAYEGVVSRAVSVDSAAITEALRKVYGVAPLADELVSGHR